METVSMPVYYCETIDTEPPQSVYWPSGTGDLPAPGPINCDSCRATSVPPDHTCAAYLRERLDAALELIGLLASTQARDATEFATRLRALTGAQMPPTLDPYTDPGAVRQAVRQTVRVMR